MFEDEDKAEDAPPNVGACVYQFTETYAALPLAWDLAKPPREVIHFMEAARDLGDCFSKQPVKVLDTPESLTELTEETPWALVPSAVVARLSVGANEAVKHLAQIATVRSAAGIDSNESQMFQAMIGAMYELENRSRVAHGLPALPSRLKL